MPIRSSLDEELAATALPERWQVICWRLTSLAEAGYGDLATAVLATSARVDLHEAVDLVARGCPPDTALRILF